MMRTLSKLLPWLAFIFTLHVHAASAPNAIVIDDSAIGRKAADERSPEVYRYPKHLQVKIMETASAPDGVAVFRLEQVVLPEPGTQRFEKVPPLWVDASHLVLFDDMKPIRTCWPFQTLSFKTKFSEVKVSFNADGSGSVHKRDAELVPIPVWTYESRGVIGLRDRRGQQLYVLILDKNTGEFLLPDSRVVAEKRDCRPAQRQESGWQKLPALPAFPGT